MADVITKAVKELNADTSVKQYHISYEIESGGKTNSFVVVIKAEDMDDSSDEAEAKTKANVKAAEIKSAWVSALAEETSTSDVATLEGEVSL